MRRLAEHHRTGDGEARSLAGSPLTRPAADLSPKGRGEEDRDVPLTWATRKTDRPRPNGERDGVRGPWWWRSARRLDKHI